MNKSDFKLLIFDLDGTLVDSLKDIAMAVNHTRVIYGFEPLKNVEVRELIGDGIESLIKSVLPDISSNDQEKALANLKEYYGNNLLKYSFLYSGIKELLEGSFNKTKVILTNKPEDFSKRILDGLGIKDYFSLVWGGDTGLKKKPDPEPLERIMKHFGFNRAETLMIGDGINDILSAKNAGVKCASVSYGYTDIEKLTALKPDYIFNQPEELKNIL